MEEARCVAPIQLSNVPYSLLYFVIYVYVYILKRERERERGFLYKKFDFFEILKLRTLGVFFLCERVWFFGGFFLFV